MTPVQNPDTGMRCQPEWLRLNHLLSYCTRTLPQAAGITGQDASPEIAPRCNRKDCLFSARRS
ncbi:MAG TPA: hypothetical protein VEC35_20230 [Noviherbaspirillum sp.]|nr:hypothetical protein [Noviherbaspirillum sp.]